jgi:hypothetical protein
MGKQRREQSQDSIFVDNPFVDGFLEWMGSREGRQCIEVRDVLWDLLATFRRKIDVFGSTVNGFSRAKTAGLPAVIFEGLW